MTIFFRTDANEIIASGHIMRCISIAREVMRLGNNVKFILADNNPVKLLERESIPYHILQSKWNDLESEIKDLVQYLQHQNARAMLVDSYYATKRYFSELERFVNIIYIDDYVREVLPVKAIIHYAAFEERKKQLYTNLTRAMDPTLLWGTDYIPLREEFSHVTYTVNDTVRTVLITTGGADCLGMVEGLLYAFFNEKDFDELQFIVIAGAFYQEIDQLKALEKKQRRIRVLTNVTNMSEWMRKCDVAISAGGTTLYELCACGVPTICFEVSDNQSGASVLGQNGYMSYAGNAAENKSDCIGNCVEGLRRYVRKKDERMQMSSRLRCLVDGKGANRIAKYLLDCVGGDMG